MVNDRSEELKRLKKPRTNGGESGTGEDVLETWLETSVLGSFREVPSIALTPAINRTW